MFSGAWKENKGPKLGMWREYFRSFDILDSIKRLLVFTYIYQLQEVSLISEYYMHGIHKH